MFVFLPGLGGWGGRGVFACCVVVGRLRAPPAFGAMIGRIVGLVVTQSQPL